MYGCRPHQRHKRGNAALKTVFPVPIVDGTELAQAVKCSESPRTFRESRTEYRRRITAFGRDPGRAQ